MYFFRAISLLFLLLAALITALPISVLDRRIVPPRRGDSILYRGTSREEGNSVLDGEPVRPKGASNPQGYLYLKGDDFENVRAHVLGRLGDKNSRTPFISTTPSRTIAEGFLSRNPKTGEVDGALLMIDRAALACENQIYPTNRNFKEHGQIYPFKEQKEVTVKGEIPSSAVRAVVFYQNGKKATLHNPHYEPEYC